MKRLFSFIFVLVFFLSFAFNGMTEDLMVVDEEETKADYLDQARFLMRKMTLEEKIYQLFFVTPEALTGEKRTTEINEPDLLRKYPVGGVILFGQNIVSEAQVKAFTKKIEEYALASQVFPPLIAVDEEGGSVIRIANKLGYVQTPSAEEIGKTCDAALAYEAGKHIAQYLKPLGIHLDFAPVADVVTNEDAEIIGRSYGSDAEIVAGMAKEMRNGLRDGGIIPCYKHFPGHGAVEETHKGMGSSGRTLEEMRAMDWVPFREGISEEIEMIMISHLIMRGAGDTVPASLSSMAIQEFLRDELGYEGVVITDALRMGAITKYYSAGETAVMALRAGADFLLIPADFSDAVDAVMKAVNTGKISAKSIDESVARIIALKIRYGVIR